MGILDNNGMRLRYPFGKEAKFWSLFLLTLHY